ncbi:zinc ribbon domain-containing protein [Paenibacillus solani]|uniref:zinc ribbon domain-containing protein n=1 Tax=Paenibacillus solani TaxID=1705565 RepID=UPI003D268E35
MYFQTKRGYIRMSLLPCPECGNPVSTKAFSCPKCGNPLGSGTKGDSGKRGGITFWGVVGAVIVAILIMAFD